MLMKGYKLIPLAAMALVTAACSSENVDRGSAAVGPAKDAFSGAIFTTVKDGTIVDENTHYTDCRQVYLNGGPKGGGPGLPPGDYYFMVTSPSGGPPSVLLSSDSITMRRVTVGKTGEFSFYEGTHDQGVDADDGSVTVQLWPFDETPNPGHEYKAWLTPVDKYDPADSKSTFGFIHRWSKTDNFKCPQVKPPPPPPCPDCPPPPVDGGTPPPPCEGEDCPE
jgi:hypothetical protein